MKTYYAHGKLLLSGEYCVLKGSLALAIPTKRGQLLRFAPDKGTTLTWHSYTHTDNAWLKVIFNSQLDIVESTDEGKAVYLQKLLRKGFELSGEDFKPGVATTTLEFDRNWGLGSSSTLTYLVADWLGADQMKLHFATQNGSGYDVACASAKSPLLYRKNSDIYIHHLKLPELYHSAYFIHLNQKQLSKPEVDQFLASSQNPVVLDRISEISLALTLVNSELELRQLLTEHESLMSDLLNRPTVQARLFPDYKGIVKSLGAWGGDFVMAMGDNTPAYFRSKGYSTCIAFSEMAL